MTATLEFLGAAGTVTGSKFLLEVHGRRVLVDCGLCQGLKELRRRNWEPLPCEPGSIEHVVLTHAHIDHSGYLPRLCRDGFCGAVRATRGTADLLRIMLPDSGRLQEEDAEYHNRGGTSKHTPALPMYTEDEGARAAARVAGVAYGAPLKLSDAMSVLFARSGHILGAAMVAIDMAGGAGRRRVVFSGDVGRYDAPILSDPDADRSRRLRRGRVHVRGSPSRSDTRGRPAGASDDGGDRAWRRNRGACLRGGPHARPHLPPETARGRTPFASLANLPGQPDGHQSHRGLPRAPGGLRRRHAGEARWRTITASRSACSPRTFRKVSCWPAKLASGRSSDVALLRTATSGSPRPTRRPSSR
jgi:glyoxylase-like metal-dependent hydrolase (beta-lactamase superfamily II)